MNDNTITIPDVFLGRMRGYCDNGDCDARQVFINIKRDEMSFISYDSIACPLCRHPLKYDGITDSCAVEQQKNDDAIGRVNVLRYKRDNNTKFVPLSVYADMTLPK